MKNKKRFYITSWRIWPLLILAGAVFLTIIFVYSSNQDMKYAEKRLLSTVGYISEQCSSYNNLNNASESRSLLRIIESVQQISRDLQEKTELHKENIETDIDLKEYTKELYLTGLILLDADGNITDEYSLDGIGAKQLEEYLTKDALLNVAEYPEKAYAVRARQADGSYADLAAFGRKDQKGIIVGYYHTSKEYSEYYTLSFQHLLSGYNTDFDGTIVVTKGDDVVASNDDKLSGAKVEDVTVLRNVKNQGESGRMLQVRSSDKARRYSYAVLDRGRNYYVYAYMAERKVFTNTPQNLLYAVILYLIAVGVIHTIRWKMKQSYQEEQIRKEQEYQKKLMESARKAESANVAKTEFLQRMSHDIRTPINGIRGMVEIGNHYKDDMEKQAECRQKIWEASGLLLELVNEVLDMGKLESGEVVLEERPFNIVTLMLETKDVLEKTAAARCIVMETKELSLQHTELIGSPLHVKRLLMNILSNAVKYNKDNGRIMMDCKEVRCTEDTVWIEFICEDTGIGMSKEYQKHIFEPFTQENHDARSTYNGTGLGMAITKSLVDKMGGTISFESKQGVGTRNVITLPFKIDSEAEKNHSEKASQTEDSIAGMHVLLVEDNELNMEIAEFVLKNAGAKVARAVNGKEGFEKFRVSSLGEYDIILMDVMMPVMDGYQATKAIRSLEREDAQKIPIVAMTANAFAEDRKQAQEAGMNEHLVKPLEPDKVIHTLAHYYRERR